ncbi:hypothetical protein PGJ_00017020 [Porphyromonas gingivalis AJW4]|nr:hypothetical protein PGJ_00017020 [Porphyromonas gingivalis AJW4]
MPLPIRHLPSSVTDRAGVFFLSCPEKAFWGLRFIYKSFTIYIFIENDLYINWKRSIYKLKMVYIQIVRQSSKEHIPSNKSPFSRIFHLAFPHTFSCLFRMILSSSSLLKTFLAVFFPKNSFFPLPSQADIQAVITERHKKPRRKGSRNTQNQDDLACNNEKYTSFAAKYHQ